MSPSDLDDAREAKALEAISFRLLIEQSSDMLAMLASDGRVLYHSPSVTRILGYEPAELIGRDAYSLVHPEDLERVQAVFVRVLHEPGQVACAQYRYRHRNGTWRVLETTGRAFPHTDGVLGFVSSRDVTERHAAEQRAGAEAAVRVAIEQSMRGGVMALDMDGRITYVNRAFCDLTGRSAAELIGAMPPYPYWHPDDRQEILASMKHVLAGRVPENGFETRWMMPDGSVRFIHLLPAALRNPDGSLRGALGCAFDLTERKKLEEQLRQAQKMEAVGRLAGGVAHDFNNLLTAILGYADLAIDQLPEGSPIRTDLLEIHRAGTSAAALTRQLLAFSRRQVLQLQNIDLNVVVRNTSRMLRRLIGEYVMLETVLHGGPLVVRADAGQLEQVLMNLAVNSRDAMPDGGTLTIQTEVLPQDDGTACVRLSVIDTGCGMSPDVQAHVFEPFFSTKSRGEGTGLGLATVYGIVQQLGGRVAVHSAPGAGTTLDVVLPLSSGSAVEPERGPATTRSVRPHGRILVVEDADAVRTLASEVLQGAGYDVLQADSGATALDLIQKCSGLDLVLTDVVMPGMSGLELANHLRRKTPGLPVLFMSGYPDRQAMPAGPDGKPAVLLPKPFSAQTLLQAVGAALTAA